MTCCKDKLDNKTAIGIVVKDNELVMSEMLGSEAWSGMWTDTSLINMSEALSDMNGKNNTALLVAEYPSGAYRIDVAISCNDYTGGISSTAGKWYLPAAGELYRYVHGNYNTLILAANMLGWVYFDNTYWSSSEYDYDCAWRVGIENGSIGKSDKVVHYQVSCFLPFSVNNGVATPCSSSYQYTCSGTGESGSGTACGGLYKSCNCANGYEWNGSSCVVKVLDCEVGYIYYTDNTCSSGYDSSKTVAGIVVKKNALVMSSPIQMKWSSVSTDVVGLTDISAYTKAEKDVDGQNNTAIIVSEHSSSGLTASNSAAMYCNSYVGGVSGSEGQWYLPAYGELYSYVYGNYSELLPKASALSWEYFESSYFWSSSEQTGTAAWFVSSSSGFIDDYIDVYRKRNVYSVSCFLPISVSNGEATPCGSEYKNACSGTGYNSGSGDVCGIMYKSCDCEDKYVWSGNGCVCDDSFKYTCNGYAETHDYLSSSECEGKYKSCECFLSGYTWNGSGCVASCSDTSCKVGHILYSDGTCCKDKLDNKTAIGVVVKDNELVMSELVSLSWASNETTDVSGITNTRDPETDYNGKGNTLAIVAAYPNDTSSNNAGIYCNSYSTTSTSAGQWYLPADGELYDYIYRNKTAISKVSSELGWNCCDSAMWSSTEVSTSNAWDMFPYNGKLSSFEKKKTLLTSCFLPINVNNGVATPCGSEYKYTCSGTGESGSGTACGGLYTSCNCANGYEWNGSSCMVSCSDTSCSVGNIYYTDGTCCKDVLASKTPVGVVVKDNALVMSIPVKMKWASSYVDVSGLTNYTSISDAKTDYNGKANTLAIVSAYPSDTTSNNAAIYCNSYSTAVTSAGQWYLPAAGEIYGYIYANNTTLEATLGSLGSFPSAYFWSSSESIYAGALYVHLDDGTMNSHLKDNTDSVSCLLDISDEEDSCSDTSCSVGNILYSDMTCCKDVLSNKTAIGVVVKTNELVMSLSTKNMTWASSYVDVSGVINYTSSTSAKTDYNGKANTLAIVAAYPSDTTSNNAAIYCNSYSTAGTSAGQWYLPAAGETYEYIYANNTTLEATFGSFGLGFPSIFFWSSSEYDYYYAWVVGPYVGGMGNDTKGINNYSVRCLLDISDEEDSCSDTSCSVGNILYSDGTCCKDLLDNKTPIGIVVKDNELVIALNVPHMTWANSFVDVSELPNFTFDPETDYNGKSNTLAIVSAYPSDTTSNNAAIYCNKYTTAGTSAGQWYLPALGEVSDYIDMQYTTIKSGWDKVGTTISDSWFWSSSEFSWYEVWGIGCPESTVIWDDKDEIRSVGCFLDISN